MKSLLMILLFSSGVAIAQENVAVIQRYEGAFSVGSIFSPETTQKTSLLGTTSTEKTKDRAGFAYGAEMIYNFTTEFSGVFFADSAKYTYKNGGDSDELLSFQIGPRYRKLIAPKLMVWGSFGLGYFVNRLGSVSQVSDDGAYLFTFDKRDAGGFIFNPRIGSDLALNEKISLRIQLGYSQTSFSYDFNVHSISSGAAVGNGKIDVDRSWFTGYVGITGGF